MYITSGANAHGMVSSPHAKLDDALAKASEFLSAGMTHVGIRDLEQSTYTAQEIELLVRMANAEFRQQAPSVSPANVDSTKSWWKWWKR